MKYVQFGYVATFLYLSRHNDLHKTQKPNQYNQTPYFGHFMLELSGIAKFLGNTFELKPEHLMIMALCLDTISKAQRTKASR